jgi:hemerythrin-like domain-containing protein
MLAAECAWAILHAEHARMRELLMLVDDELKAGNWTQGGPQSASLTGLIERLRAFDTATHRPKGVVLIQTLRGRSAESDDLLQRLEQQRERCDSLLSQAKAALDRGDAGTADEVATVLQEHHRLMRAHLDEEDTLLHSQTAKLLTTEDWAAVASAISEAIGPRRS